ncbi:orotidine-5'-phosphate decarboxylase [Candidatus Woesearchaeota archaeon]|nr:orotidine-5'-phosphate decarboxylase [Candidatus Woesearchaeota archaeon]
MFDRLKQQYIDGIYQSGAFLIKEEPFTLRSGIKSHIYIDHKRFLTNHTGLKIVINNFFLMLKEKVDHFTFVVVDSIMSPILGSTMATMLDKDLVIIKEEQALHGTREKTYGIIHPNQEYVIIDDLISTGSLVMNAAKPIRELGGIVRYAVVCTVREDAVIKELNNHGIEVIYISTINEILEYLKPTLTQQEQQIVEDKHQCTTSYLYERMKMSYQERSELAKNSVGRALYRIMEKKKTNLILSADVTKADKVITIARELGPFIVGLKTHIDIIDDFNQQMINDLQTIADEYEFLIFEDRKFAEIGNTAQLQYKHGVYHIITWADIVNAHSVPGEGVVQGLCTAAKEHYEPRGCLLIAQMSSKNNLVTREYSQKTLEIAELFPDFVIGFIATGGDPLKLRSFAHKVPPHYLLITPGIRFGSKADTMQQSYGTPEEAIHAGSDIIIVGRGIYESQDMKETAKQYRDAGWKAYEERKNIVP